MEEFIRPFSIQVTRGDCVETVTLQKGIYTLDCFVPQAPAREILYLHSPGEGHILPEVLLERAAAICVCISGEDWDGDLTPWPAPGVFGRKESFGGRAAGYLEILAGELLPLAEGRLGANGLPRGIVGVSLSGLFAVYAVVETALFSQLCSISGSLWYDGFLDYLQSHPVSRTVRRAYFSVGDREKYTKNPRMRQVEDCTLQAARLFRERGIGTCFERNPGGHFVDGAQRLEKGLQYLLKEALETQKGNR